MLSSQQDNNEVLDSYLANLVPPSHVNFEDNNYILNLADIGGYLDGSNVNTSSGRRECTSPSVCGHIVNHFKPLKSLPKVVIVPFLWRDILESDDMAGFVNEQILKDLPNTMRCDAFPWCFDTVTQTMLHPLLAGPAGVSVDNMLRPGQELLLDYHLRVDRLPNWAKIGTKHKLSNEFE